MLTIPDGHAFIGIATPLLIDARTGAFERQLPSLQPFTADATSDSRTLATGSYNGEVTITATFETLKP